MPKTEKKLKEDVSSLQQRIKRRIQSPGNTSDVGEWEGAADSKYRNGSFGGISGYAFEFVASLSLAIPNLWISILLHSLSLSSLCLLKLTKTFEESIRVAESKLLNTGKIAAESLHVAESKLLNTGKNAEESLDIVDSEILLVKKVQEEPLGMGDSIEVVKV